MNPLESEHTQDDVVESPTDSETTHPANGVLMVGDMAALSVPAEAPESEADFEQESELEPAPDFTEFEPETGAETIGLEPVAVYEPAAAPDEGTLVIDASPPESETVTVDEPAAVSVEGTSALDASPPELETVAPSADEPLPAFDEPQAGGTVLISPGLPHLQDSETSDDSTGSDAESVPVEGPQLEAPMADPSGTPPWAAAPHGTVLIPTGATTLPEGMRSAPTIAEQDSADTPASPDVAEGDPAVTDMEAPPAMDLAAALAAAARNSSIPPVRPSTEPPVVRPSLSGLHTAEDPGGTQEAKAGLFRQRAVLLIALLGLGALLATVAILVVAQQRADARRQRVQQVLAAHAVALDTIEDANDLVIDAMRSLATSDRPDLTSLVEAGTASGKLFEGLRVPAARGDQVELGRRLKNAIEAEAAFLDRLVAFGARDLADVRDVDIDRLRDAWTTAEEAIRTSYDDQSALEVPELSRVGDTLTDFGHGMAQAAEDARERAARLSAVRDYTDQVSRLLSDLERLRASLTRANVRAMVILTSSDRSNAIDIISSASTARWSLAETMGEITPPDEMTTEHSSLIFAIEGLARAVAGLASAVGEADCSTYSYYGSYSYDSGVECSPVGSASAYRTFIRDSDEAGRQYDRAKAAHQARYAELVEAYR